jgi:hypothetical protein
MGATLGGSLQMDLSYATIPVGAQGHITLYNKPKRKEHIERPDYGDSQSNYNSINPCFPQDWATLPFAEEDSIDEVIWPKGGGTRIHLTNTRASELGPVKILTQGNEEKLHLHKHRYKEYFLGRILPPCYGTRQRHKRG